MEIDRCIKCRHEVDQEAIEVVKARLREIEQSDSVSFRAAVESIRG